MKTYKSSVTCIFLKILFTYSWKTQREAETQAEGEGGCMQGSPPEPEAKPNRWATQVPPITCINVLYEFHN